MSKHEVVTAAGAVVRLEITPIRVASMHAVGAADLADTALELLRGAMTDAQVLLAEVEDGGEADVRQVRRIAKRLRRAHVMLALARDNAGTAADALRGAK